jgi:hypothetical protein
MVRFALNVKRIGVDSLVTKSVPADIGWEDGQSVVFLEREAEPLFQALRDGVNPDPTPEPGAPPVDGEAPAPTPEPEGPCTGFGA